MWSSFGSPGGGLGGDEVGGDMGTSSNPIPAHWADDVTDEQLAALHEYAELNGSRWKAQLGQDWMRAGSSYAGYAVLHRLRNSHGPTWLATVKLPHGYPWSRP